MGLTCGVSGVRVGAVPPCGRRAVPHALLVGRQVPHVANAAVAVSPHGAPHGSPVRELGHGVGHVVGGGHGGVVAHGVLLHARSLRHLRLSISSEWRAEVPRAVHATELLVGLLDRTQNICH